MVNPFFLSVSPLSLSPCAPKLLDAGLPACLPRYSSFRPRKDAKHGQNYGWHSQVPLSRCPVVPLSDDWNGQSNSVHTYTTDRQTTTPLISPSLLMFRLTLGIPWMAAVPGYTVHGRKWGHWIWVGHTLASGRTLRFLLACCFASWCLFPNTQLPGPCRSSQDTPLTQSVSDPLPSCSCSCQVALSGAMAATCDCEASTGKK